MSDISDIVESYTDAATILGLDPEDVKQAILDAARRYSGCIACRYSRAPRNAEEFARNRGTLPILRRSCVLGLRQDDCGAFAPLLEEGRQ